MLGWLLFLDFLLQSSSSKDFASHFIFVLVQIDVVLVLGSITHILSVRDLYGFCNWKIISYFKA